VNAAPGRSPRRRRLAPASAAGALFLGLLASAFFFFFFFADDPQGADAATLPALTSEGRVGPRTVQGSAGSARADPLDAREHSEHSGRAAPGKGIRWDGADLIIDLRRVPVHDAIRMLAAQTRTSVHGGELMQGPDVTLEWQGRDVRAAWQRLLGASTAFAMTCAPAGCQVFIGGPPAAAAGPVLARPTLRASHGAAAAPNSPATEGDEPVSSHE
jgi:hypothetical protein